MDFIEDSLHNRWYVYVGALICYQRPYDEIRTTKKELQKLLRQNKCWFARWTSDFDGKDEKSWWYCLKEIPLSIKTLTAKQRYRVNKGLKNIRFFRVTEAEFEHYKIDFWETFYQSVSQYPIKYRPNIDKEKLARGLLSCCMSGCLWGGVSTKDNHLCCWATLKFHDDSVVLSQLKVHPSYLKDEANAGFAYSICDYYLNKEGYKYIIDGERNIRHETKYQDFLIANLGFRKAYCKLNIVYHPLAGLAVKLLYPFRNLLKLFSDKFSLIYNIYCVLKQEECRINCK